eukprot:scaffold178080_cov35-Prasinocladus_malaysianus.AAC.1
MAGANLHQACTVRRPPAAAAYPISRCNLFSAIKQRERGLLCLEQALRLAVNRPSRLTTRDVLKAWALRVHQATHIRRAAGVYYRSRSLGLCRRCVGAWREGWFGCSLIAGWLTAVAALLSLQALQSASWELHVKRAIAKMHARLAQSCWDAWIEAARQGRYHELTNELADRLRNKFQVQMLRRLVASWRQFAAYETNLAEAEVVIRRSRDASLLRAGFSAWAGFIAALHRIQHGRTRRMREEAFTFDLGLPAKSAKGQRVFTGGRKGTRLKNAQFSMCTV